MKEAEEREGCSLNITAGQEHCKSFKALRLEGDLQTEHT